MSKEHKEIDVTVLKAPKGTTSVSIAGDEHKVDAKTGNVKVPTEHAAALVRDNGFTYAE